MDEGCRVIHCDVMDGHFVPPITFGPMVVAALRESLPDEAYLDVHLMIERPERHVEEFAKAGADGITIHVEATPHIDYTLARSATLGCKAGLVVCPGTPPDHFAQADDLDLALIMTVNPGWGGQPFLRSQLDKIRRVREMLGAGRRDRGRRRRQPGDRRRVRRGRARRGSSPARRSSAPTIPSRRTTRSPRRSAPSRGPAPSTLGGIPDGRPGRRTCMLPA